MKTQIKIKYLEKARDLISDKENWCQDYPALDKSGNLVDYRSRKATRFCAIGAVYKAIRPNMNPDTLEYLLDREAAGFGYKIVGMVALNDDKTNGHTHRRVISAFNRTIKKLQKQLEQGK